jgi:hypothetical protein
MCLMASTDLIYFMSYAQYLMYLMAGTDLIYSRS